MLDITLLDLFAAQVSRTPEKIALQFQNIHLSYRDLDERSTKLANYLVKKGVSVEDFIPICIDRSLEMIISILGVLKAGAVYVPIDPEYPKERISYIINDTKCDFIITNGANHQLMDALTGSATLITVDTDWSAIQEMESTPTIVNIKPNNLAYIIYTSGSTGTPKGVMIEHYNVVRLFFNDSPFFDFNEHDVWTMFHSFCFDFSVWEMYGALLYGGKLIIVPKETAKNANAFAELIAKEKVTILNQTPSAFYILQEYILNQNSDDLALRYIIYGGEALNPLKLKTWKNRFKECRLINGYGITETTVFTTFIEITEELCKSSKSLIGWVIPTLYGYVLNANQEKCNINEEGELYIGGEGLARGYLNLPELTDYRFIIDHFNKDKTAKLYRSGDIVKLLADGSYEYVGRIDEQVKINGYRIELGEIENNINQFPGIEQIIVIAKESSHGEKKLVGYYKSEVKIDKQSLIKFLQQKMPDHMVPRIYIKIDYVPLTSNGKADKRAIEKIKISRPDLDTIYKKPQSVTENNIYNIWNDFLEIDKIGIDDNFFELGGNSLMAQSTIVALRNTYQYELPITKIYQLPTIAALAGYLEKSQKKHRSLEPERGSNITADIAVIGLAGRFPGADTIEEFWSILEKGKETVTFFNDEIIDSSIPNDLKDDPAYVKARGIIEDADMFDPSFFGITTTLAELMDPQQRIFLEIAWECLEKTGYLPSTYKEKIGVFAGFGTNTYYENNVLSHSDKIESQGKIQVLSVNEKDYAASRTAYHLNLKGPAVSVNSACSTSLLAITQAVNSLRANQCVVALAGGASITSPINSGYLYQEGSMLSADGHCKPFDDNATGTTFSDGAGIVLLKRLDEAKQDGDHIFAIIKGVGINNDGYGKGSFTAPSSVGQSEAIICALKDGGIDASQISYVEAHGTGTPIGDPIEFEGLVDAFGLQQKKQYCAIGSVKGNFGHLTQAAGVAGFIKTCLALHYKKIPASIGYDTPNKNIDFKNSPFYVNTKLSKWVNTEPRFAGISSFGVGGTNVHVILESFENDVKVTGKNAPFELIRLSAHSENSLTKYQTALANYLQHNTNNSLSNIAYTLHTKRKPFKLRKFKVVDSETQLIDTLNNPDNINTNLLTEVPSEIIFSFPGQGTQYVNMGLALYQNEPVYKAAIDNCALILKDFLDKDIRTIIYTEENLTASNELKNTIYTQPALFVTEYALAQLWMSWGIEPDLLIGHSVGEFVAAQLAGVFSLADALKLVANRGLLISKLSNGSMLSVRQSATVVQGLLNQDLSIAAVNGPMLCVVSGPTDQIAGLSKLLDQQAIVNKPLFTSHAFHSSMMDPVLNDFKSIVEKVGLSKPSIKIISTVTGEILSDEQALDINYWTNHLRKTVQFNKAVETIINQGSPIFLEVGPGTVTSTLIKQIAAANKTVVKTIVTLDPNDDALASTLNAMGQLWINGVDINWDLYYTEQNMVELPTYQFDRKKYWLSAKQNNVNTPSTENQLISSKTVLPKDETNMRKENLTREVKQLLEDASGIEMMHANNNQNFLEIGFDSLLLTQVATSLKRKFKLPITFRKLNEEYANLNKLVDYLDANLPAEEIVQVTAVQQKASMVSSPVYNATHTTLQPTFTTDNSALGLITQQLNILTQQLALLQGENQLPNPFANQAQGTTQPLQSEKIVSVSEDNNNITQEEKAEIQKPFGATPKIERHANSITPQQENFLKDLIGRYNTKTAKSKAYTNESRTYMADPRVVSGFKPLTKELIYPIVINKSKGSKLWDLDGNEYIDALNGFGSNMLGHQPDVITTALHNQIEKGYEVGPQHELAASVTKLICEFTGFDRSALCSTGSEAVLGCIRIARTVTGRSLIVAFAGSYHGIVDEVLVRGTKKLKSFPAAAGIMPEAVQNILVLEYGTPESMAIIKERGDEIAAVLVETIQSRRPEFIPIDFLNELRTVTKQNGAVLIFDEVITGFRFHPGGAQAILNIKADLASYGKVVGAGIPIGVIAGDRSFMDALDGGGWQYGDDSFPEIGVTYFAGTFVRHPLALASAQASLLYMKQRGPALQKELNDKGDYISKKLNDAIEKRQLPMYVANYGSMWKVKYHEELPYSELLFVLLREKGIHILDGFPCFITEATSQSDLDQIVNAFLESMDEMISIGFFPGMNKINNNFDPYAVVIDANVPPVKGAKLGKDQDGNPAWFIKDPSDDAKYIQISTN